MAANKAPSVETFISCFPMPVKLSRSLRGGAAVASGGFKTAHDARRYLMSKAPQVTVKHDEIIMHCAHESTARDFAACVYAAGGEVWDVRYLGKGRGYSVLAIIGLAWARYFAS